MKRMVIHGWRAPLPHEDRTPDGLPPFPELPLADGKIASRFIGKRTFIDAWHSESVTSIAKSYARACVAAQDLEIDALKVERDALKTALDELKAAHG
jgi:hypothetical protein